jgi:hypothetical protein
MESVTGDRNPGMLASKTYDVLAPKRHDARLIPHQQCCNKAYGGRVPQMDGQARSFSSPRDKDHFQPDGLVPASPNSIE